MHFYQEPVAPLWQSTAVIEPTISLKKYLVTAHVCRKGPFIHSANANAIAERTTRRRQRKKGHNKIKKNSSYRARTRTPTKVSSRGKPRRLPSRIFRRRSRRLSCSTNQCSQFRLSHHVYYVTTYTTSLHCGTNKAL